MIAAYNGFLDEIKLILTGAYDDQETPIDLP